MKIVHNSSVLHPISKKLDCKFALKNTCELFAKLLKKKMRKIKKKESAKNIRQSLKKDTYLFDGLVDLAEIWNGICPTLQDFLQQKWCSSIQVLFFIYE